MFSEIYDLDPKSMQHAILVAYRGSISHGTYRPNTDPNSVDDIDVVGLVVPPDQYYYGLKEFGSRGTKEIKRNEWDVVLYEIRKALRMLGKGNPNIFSLLWLRTQDYIKTSEAGELLLENRDLFSSKIIFHSFVGYAHGQIHRMTHSPCKGYLGAKRKQLVEKFGWDCKNGAHAIRLLRMGIEFLLEGQLHVFRPDAEELVAIKRGEWSLEKVLEESNRLLTLAHEAYVKSTLPATVDWEKIDDLSIEIIKTWRNECSR